MIALVSAIVALSGRAVDLPVKGSAPSNVLFVAIGCVVFVSLVAGVAHLFNKRDERNSESRGDTGDH